MISCIIPCYGSSATISRVVDELCSTLDLRKGVQYEIILVNDSSPDNVLEVIRNICKINKRIKAIDLAKNFGQHSAIMAGIRYSSGEIYAFLDDDGQTPPSEIWKLLDALDENCDIAFASYANKQHASWRNLGSKVNSYMAEKLIGKPKNLELTSYFACKKFVAQEVNSYDGPYPYLAGLLLRTTKKIKNIEVQHREREIGDSGYTLKKLLKLWLNGFTAFSVKPLRIATIVGATTALIGFLYGINIVLRYFFGHNSVLGWSSLIASSIFFNGIIMIMLGLIGEYVGRIFISINRSPQFVIREKIGYDDENK